MQYIFAPIDGWPGEPTDPYNRQQSRFKATWSKTCTDLDRELEALDAKNVVIQIDVQRNGIRLDGLLYAGVKIASPRVIISFESKHGPLSYPCDRFTHWQANVRAIALSLEALRAVDRYGVTRQAEQYRGWEKLAAPKVSGEAAVAVLAKWSTLPTSDIRGDKAVAEIAYRRAVQATHPDCGGKAEDFKTVQEAWEVLRA